MGSGHRSWSHPSPGKRNQEPLSSGCPPWQCVLQVCSVSGSYRCEPQLCALGHSRSTGHGALGGCQLFSGSIRCSLGCQAFCPWASPQ